MSTHARRVGAALLATGLVFSGVGAPVAGAESSIRNGLEVNQGWQFGTLAGECTIGYNDPVNRVS